MLNHAVFEHENVVKLESRVVVPVGVESYNRKPDFFSEDSNRILIFVDLRRSW